MTTVITASSNRYPPVLCPSPSHDNDRRKGAVRAGRLKLSHLLEQLYLPRYWPVALRTVAANRSADRFCSFAVTGQKPHLSFLPGWQTDRLSMWPVTVRPDRHADHADMRSCRHEVLQPGSHVPCRSLPCCLKHAVESLLMAG